MSEIRLVIDQQTQAQQLAAVNAGLTQMLSLLQQVDKYKDLIGKAAGDPKDLLRLAAELAKIEKQLAEIQKNELILDEFNAGNYARVHLQGTEGSPNPSSIL